MKHLKTYRLFESKFENSFINYILFSLTNFFTHHLFSIHLISLHEILIKIH